MRRSDFGLSILAFCLLSLGLSSCASLDTDGGSYGGSYAYNAAPADYSSRLSPTIASNEKTVVIDPQTHAWGAYENGSLVKAGQATAGSDWCPDLGRPCNTSSGSFRVASLGDATCKSRIFPKPKGGAPMPYCMFFHGGQAMHGSSEGEVVDANISHGCVRMHVADAEWLRYNFVNVGTRVVVMPY